MRARRRSPKSPSFAPPSSARRLIPISGYYESQDTPSGKQPYYFTARDGSPALTIAGLWDEWRDKGSGEVLKS
jgi:putative SOS response-associated peptidase YedK